MHAPDLILFQTEAEKWKRCSIDIDLLLLLVVVLISPHSAFQLMVLLVQKLLVFVKRLAIKWFVNSLG